MKQQTRFKDLLYVLILETLNVRAGSWGREALRPGCFSTTGLAERLLVLTQKQNLKLQWTVKYNEQKRIHGGSLSVGQIVGTLSYLLALHFWNREL